MSATCCAWQSGIWRTQRLQDCRPTGDSSSPTKPPWRSRRSLSFPPATRPTAPAITWVTFQILPRFVGEEYAELATYFESCRTKRNVGAYDRGGEISETEADELLSEATDFKSRVEAWIRINHPELR